MHHLFETKTQSFETAPWTAIDTISGIILSKCNLNTKHWNIAIDKQINRSRHEHQVERPETFQLSSDILHIFIPPRIVNGSVIMEAGLESPIPTSIFTVQLCYDNNFGIYFLLAKNSSSCFCFSAMISLIPAASSSAINFGIFSLGSIAPQRKAVL